MKETQGIISTQSRARTNINLQNLTEEEILGLRICDLPLAIKGTWLEECRDQLYEELNAKGIVFKPLCYLADEWLTPENEPAIGVPFYLAHPALIRLEKNMMQEAEGETRVWCMKLLRHEAGHAITYAYKLNKKKRWKEFFGSSREEYGETYRFRPYSKSYVRHLEGFYAQYHPDEDFVETFAVWLTPGLDWQKQYQGWKALKKLHYVDQLMNEIKGKEPLVKSAKKYWHFKALKGTLRNFYKKRTCLRAEDFPHFHDGNLKKIFPPVPEQSKPLMSAHELLQKYRKNILDEVAVWTGEKKYVIHELFKTISQRCHNLRLAVSTDESAALLRLVVYMTTLIMNYIYTGWYRGDEKKRLK